MSRDTRLNDLIDKFTAIAENPKEQFARFLAEGKKVVLTVPEYTPNEMIHSLGLVPFGAWGADIALGRAKEYFPAFICSILQSALELGMRGAFDGASAIVIPSFCDSLKAMGENWKYAVPKVPFVPMVYPQNRGIDAAAAFTAASYKRVADDLTRLTGAVFSDAALHGSIEKYNVHNALMRDLEALLAKRPGISPRQRSAVFKSAFFATVEEHTELVRALLELLREAEVGESSGAPAKTRIVTSGIVADNPSLLDALADNGFWIVADDIAAESRQYRTDAPAGGDPLLRLSEKYRAMGDCSVLYDPEKRRIARLVRVAKERDAVGVLVFLTKFCDPEEYDAPLLRRACDAAGLPFALIEVDRQMVEYGQARTAIEAFREMVA